MQSKVQCAFFLGVHRAEVDHREGDALVPAADFVDAHIDHKVELCGQSAKVCGDSERFAPENAGHDETRERLHESGGEADRVVQQGHF